MNGLFQTPYELTGPALPVEFEALAPPPQLLPGEHLEHYQALRHAIFADLVPRSAIEWLLAIDVAELCWEIQRYRMLRHKLLETYRQRTIEAALGRIDMVGIEPEFEADAESYTLQNALSWRIDPMAANEIEARLATYGFDQHAITTEVYVQAREVLVLFEGLLSAAQTKRMLLLREIRNQRLLSGPIRRPLVEGARVRTRPTPAQKQATSVRRAGTMNSSTRVLFGPRGQSLSNRPRPRFERRGAHRSRRLEQLLTREWDNMSFNQGRSLDTRRKTKPCTALDYQARGVPSRRLDCRHPTGRAQ